MVLLQKPRGKRVVAWTRVVAIKAKRCVQTQDIFQWQNQQDIVMDWMGGAEGKGGIKSQSQTSGFSD